MKKHLSELLGTNISDYFLNSLSTFQFNEMVEEEDAILRLQMESPFLKGEVAFPRSRKCEICIKEKCSGSLMMAGSFSYSSKEQFSFVLTNLIGGMANKADGQQASIDPQRLLQGWMEFTSEEYKELGIRVSDFDSSSKSDCDFARVDFEAVGQFARITLWENATCCLEVLNYASGESEMDLFIWLDSEVDLKKTLLDFSSFLC